MSTELCRDSICCTPLSEIDAATMASRLKALSDPTRLRLFSLISTSDEQCACDLTDPLGVGQPTVSHHLKVLHDAGLVTRDQRGKWVYYAVVPEALQELSEFLNPAAGANAR